LHIIAIIAWMAGMLYLRGCSSITAKPLWDRYNRKPSR
jgi:hypothetical protein